MRAFLPGAAERARARGRRGRSLGDFDCRHAEGVFEAPGRAQRGPYRLPCAGPTAPQALLDDPYRFGPVLGELDV